MVNVFSLTPTKAKFMSVSFSQWAVASVCLLNARHVLHFYRSLTNGNQTCTAGVKRQTSEGREGSRVLLTINSMKDL